MYCPNCGKEVAEGTRFCAECGKPVESVPPQAASPTMEAQSQQPSQAPPIQQQYQAQPIYTKAPVQPRPPAPAYKTILAIVSFCMAAFAMFWFFFAESNYFMDVGMFVFGLIIAIGAIVLGAMSNRKPVRLFGFGVAGLTVGIIAAVFLQISVMAYY